MVIAVLVAAFLAAHDISASHVRSCEPQITALIQAGVEQSETLRRLVEALDRSDVIVYVNLKVRREALGGYLAHNVSNAGPYRYLHVAISLRGTEARLISILAHELQHALEVAEHVDARDADRVERLFARLSLSQGCAVGNCFETVAAQDVEAAVLAEVRRGAR
jgi:hypothetical protein